MKHEEKNYNEVKMHKFLVCAYKSQDFAQSQKFFARSHDRETVNFRNSGWGLIDLPWNRASSADPSKGFHGDNSEEKSVIEPTN